MIKLRFTLFALIALSTMLGSCELASTVSNLVPDSDNFDFTTTCKSGNGELSKCGECCKGEGFDTALVATGDCGCAYSIEDAETCKTNSDIGDCSKCCEGAGFSSTVRVTNGECRCFKVSKTK